MCCLKGASSEVGFKNELKELLEPQVLRFLSFKNDNPLHFGVEFKLKIGAVHGSRSGH